MRSYQSRENRYALLAECRSERRPECCAGRVAVRYTFGQVRRRREGDFCGRKCSVWRHVGRGVLRIADSADLANWVWLGCTGKRAQRAGDSGELSAVLVHVSVAAKR